jgi:hypothetical protein
VSAARQQGVCQSTCDVYDSTWPASSKSKLLKFGLSNYYYWKFLMRYDLHPSDAPHSYPWNRRLFLTHFLRLQQSAERADRQALFENDASLARMLEVAPPLLSKIWHRLLPVGTALIICMHKFSNLPISELQSLMDDRRQKYQISLIQEKL